jgi:signal transduction histidine kinase
MGASVLVAVTVAAGSGSPAELPASAWIAVSGVVAATVMFRVAPRTGLLVGAAALVGYHVAVGDPLGLAWPLVVAVYGVARAGHLWVGVGFSVAYLTAVVSHRAIEGVATDGLTLLHAAAQEGLLLAGALLVGEVVRTRVLQAETARERLTLLQRHQDEETQRRIAEERLRIAHDLHDLTAHTVAVISLHAGVARERFDRDPDQARASLSTIDATSKQAAKELRGLVGLLRSDEPPPPDGLDAVHRAVDAARSTGLMVDLHIEPPGLTLTGPTGIAAARIVQESLTNVLRHARAEHAAVTIRATDGTLEIWVTDDGASPIQHAGVPQPGVGLRGMRERVDVLGGTLTHGRGTSGGFEVHARLPPRSSP